jgi:hypothetical protein
VVFCILARQHPDLSIELPQLISSLIAFVVLTAASAGSFVGQLRARRWRGWAHTATVAVLAGVVLLYWPRGR